MAIFLPRAWHPFFLRCVGIAGVALGLRFLEWVFLPRPMEYIVPTILLIGGVYLGFFELSPVPGKRGMLLKKGVGLLFVLLGFWLALPEKPEAVMPWQPYSEAALASAKASHQPVIIDFFADWCLPCHILERETFSRKRVVEAAKGFVLLRADLSEQNSAESLRIAEKFGIDGFPVVVFLGADGAERRDLRLLGPEAPDDFLRRIEQMK